MLMIGDFQLNTITSSLITLFVIFITVRILINITPKVSMMVFKLAVKLDWLFHQIHIQREHLEIIVF